MSEARTSFEWFNTVGYAADIERLRQQEPALQDWEAWLRGHIHWGNMKQPGG
jgi:hypothetical protein